MEKERRGWGGRTGRKRKEGEKKEAGERTAEKGVIRH